MTVSESTIPDGYKLVVSDCIDIDGNSIGTTSVVDIDMGLIVCTFVDDDLPIEPEPEPKPEPEPEPVPTPTPTDPVEPDAGTEAPTPQPVLILPETGAVFVIAQLAAVTLLFGGGWMLIRLSRSTGCLTVAHGVSYSRTCANVSRRTRASLAGTWSGRSVGAADGPRRSLGEPSTSGRG